MCLAAFDLLPLKSGLVEGGLLLDGGSHNAIILMATEIELELYCGSNFNKFSLS